MSELILHHFDPKLPTTVYADSSRFVISGIISQSDANGILYSIAFWSWKSIPVEMQLRYPRSWNARHCWVFQALASLPRRIQASCPHPFRSQESRNIHVYENPEPLSSPLGRVPVRLRFLLDHIPGSKNPADDSSQRPDYSKDVDVPSGGLIPPKALRLLPPSLSRLVSGRHLAMCLEHVWSQPWSQIGVNSLVNCHLRVRDPVTSKNYLRSC